MIWRLAPGLVHKAIANSGAHEGSFAIFESKSVIIPLKFAQVRTPAANILKQEMLALGGDAVTPMSTILGTDKHVDVILLGTEKQYSLLLSKLEKLSFFGLDKWKVEIKDILQSEVPVTSLTNGRTLDYQKTLVMGIVNLTPDSFYDKSRVWAVGKENMLADQERELESKVKKMLAEGADIIDLGAESTRPGAKPIGEVEEQQRLLPALQLLRSKFSDVVISVDTYHVGTATQALKYGADIINDISGKDDARMQKVISKYGVPWVITHNGPGGIMEVTENLLARAEKLGLGKNQIIFDPGIGFGKSVEENLEIIRNLSMLTCYGYPILLGASRKSVIGAVLDLPPQERLEGTLAVSTRAVEQGVNIIRVHDVKENVRAIRMAEKIR